MRIGPRIALADNPSYTPVLAEMLPEPSTMRPRSLLRRRLSLTPSTALLLVTALWCVYWFFRARDYWEDDAYIHLEFARSLARGNGFAFNGLAVSGDTSPLWVLLLAASHLVIPDWFVAGKLLAILGAFFGFAGIYLFARHIAGELLDARTAALFAPAIVLFIAVNPYTCYWIYSGMETIAAAGLACWAVLLATQKQPSAIGLLAGCALAGLGPLLRPEMFVLSLLLVFPLTKQWRGLTRVPLPKIIFAIGLFLLAGPSFLWSLYSLHTFGHLLPSTIEAKRAAPDDSVFLRLLKVYGYGLPLLLALPFIAARRHLRRYKLPLSARIFLLWTLLTVAFYIVNRTLVQTRYPLLTAPALMAILLATLLSNRPQFGRAIYALFLAWFVVLSLVITRPFLRNKEINCRNYAQMAFFVRDNIPPQAPVAIYSIGEIAFLSQHPLVDIGGITRPGALAFLNEGPEAQLHWAKAEGAQYQISEGGPPEMGAQEIYNVAVPFVGWSLSPTAYRSHQTLTLWKLAPDISQAASAPAPSRP